MNFFIVEFPHQECINRSSLVEILTTHENDIKYGIHEQFTREIHFADRM